MKLKIITFILTMSIISSCKKEENIAFESIDLSIKHKRTFYSFKIGIDGKATVLTSKIDEIPKLYKTIFNKKDLKYIENALSKINLKKCDTLDYNVNDGAQYIFILNNKNDTLTLVSNTCEQLEKLDNLVFYIEKAFEKKEKKYYYKSMESLIPPPPPPLK